MELVSQDALDIVAEFNLAENLLERVAARNLAVAEFLVADRLINAHRNDQELVCQIKRINQRLLTFFRAFDDIEDISEIDDIRAFLLRTWRVEWVPPGRIDFLCP